MFFVILVTLSLILVSVYYWSVRKFNYWKIRHVKYPKPVPMFGNYTDFILQKKGRAEIAMDILQKFPDEPIVGAFYGTEPLLLVQDPEILKIVTTKDFYFFNPREHTDHNNKEFITRNLFFTYGDNWRVLRQNLTPLFSSAKMKNMFYLVEKCTRDLETMLDEETSVTNIVEIRSVMSRYTMDSICSCAYGIDAKVMGKEIQTNPFRKIAGAILETSAIRGLKTISRSIWPSLFYGLGLTLYPNQIYDFFSTVLISVFKKRDYAPSSRQDFVDLVMSLKQNKEIIGDTMKSMKDRKNEKVTLEVNEELLLALCVLFFVAGYETSSSTLSFSLFELAKNPEAQEKVLKEVDAYLASRGSVQYDCITELPFLDQCVDEALRLHPILPIISREVYEDYTLPNGTQLTKGLKVHLPVYHMHRNAKYFPDPDDFKPERFAPDVKRNLVPYTYFPFGEGPRVCIGKFLVKFLN